MSKNSTFTFLPGTTNHGNPELLCLPTKWTDVMISFLGNYVAHAGTIRLEAGTSTVGTILAVIWTLLFPISGAKRGLEGVGSFAKFGKTDLQVAARAGALCKVIKTDQQARSQRERLLTIDNSLFAGKIHGRFRLPSGYGFAIVPRNSNFDGDGPTDVPVKLSANYNVVSILVALAQLLFALATLYRTRGDQTERYGYATFGLTVTPYAMMSLLNLLGNLICPQYSAIYMARSKEMTDAERIPDGNAVFEGVVGTILEDEIQEEDYTRRKAANRSIRRIPYLIKQRNPFKNLRLWQQALLLFPTAVSIAVIYSLSQFEGRSSTTAQRVWTMLWLSYGSWVTFIAADDNLGSDTNAKNEMYTGYIIDFWTLVAYSAPSVGGFVVVAQMLNEYGICKQL